MNQVASIDQAIFEINARTNSATFCSITVQGDDNVPRVQMKHEDYHEQRVRDTVTAAFKYYPGQRVTLDVFNPNGSRKTLAKSYLLQNPNANTMGATPMYNQPPQQPQQNPFQSAPLNLDPMALYLLNEKSSQVTLLQDQVREQRDKISSLEDTIRAEREKAWALERDLKTNDREWELKIKAAELDKSGTSTLEGLGERAMSLAEKHPPLAELLLTRLLGGATPMAPIAGVPQGISGMEKIHPEARETVQELINMLATSTNQTIGELYAVALLSNAGKLNLSEIIAPYSNN